VALNWFKTEMNLRDAVVPSGGGWWGLTFIHLVVMTMLILFFVTMVIMYFFKMRRASELLERLTAEGVGVPPPSTPPPSTPQGNGPAGGASAPPPSSTPSPSAPQGNAPAGGAAAPSPAQETDKGTRKSTVGARSWTGKLKLDRIQAETPSVKTFRFANPAGGALPFTFLPGQFLTLSAAIDGKNVSRAYTIASSPTVTMYCEHTIKREEQGVFSRFLHDRLKRGNLIDARGANGGFVFTGAEASSIVLIGGGVGVTPMMSVIRYLAATAWQGNITLFFACKTPADFIFGRELEELQAKTPTLHVFVTVDQSKGSNWTGLQGYLTKDVIEARAPGIGSSRIHLCGPVPFMEAIKKILAELKVPNELIKTENFGPLRAAEPRIPLGRGPAESIVSTNVVVDFSLARKQAFLPRNMSVLEAAESIGVEIDNSCRAGTCGLCKVELTSGTVTMAVQDALTDEDKTNRLILACQAKSTVNLVVAA